MKSETIDEVIGKLKLHSKLIGDKLQFPLNILRKFNCEPDKWEIENIQLDENATEFDASSKNIFSSVFDINRKEQQNFSDRLNHETLFSSLISKTTNTESCMDSFNLDIPNLPENASLVHWQIPTSSSYEWIDYNNLMVKYVACGENTNEDKDEESGFCTDKSSPLSTSDDSSSLDSHDDEAHLIEAAWKDAMKFEISDYSNWEMRDE